jgi:hypothetical protein
LSNVLGAAAPEASVDEDGDARTREDEVGASSCAAEREVDQESQTGSVQRRAQRELAPAFSSSS